MSKNPPKPPTKNPPRPPAKKKTVSSGAMLGIVLGAVVLLAAVVAIAIGVTSGGDSSAAAGDEQYRPVRITSGGALPPGAGSSDDPAIGQAAPGLDGGSFDGTAVSFTPGGGQPTLVVFGAHWCPHCQVELPHLQELVNEGRMPEGLQIVAVSTGVQQGAENYPPSAWFDEMQWSNPVIADDEASSAARAFGLESYPMLVAVDGNGVVQGRVTGELTDEQLTTFLQSTLDLQLG